MPTILADDAIELQWHILNQIIYTGPCPADKRIKAIIWWEILAITSTTSMIFFSNFQASWHNTN